MNLTKSGYDEEMIISLTNIPQTEVKRIMEDERYVQDIAKKAEEDQVPLMKQISAMSFEILNRELMLMLLDDNYRRRFIKSTKDLIAIKVLANDISVLTRLHEDKTTGNLGIGVAVRQTGETLKQLAQADPVFGLPEPKKEEDVN